ncbi:MAG TPA: MerR family transcriptional regulator [Candidatus Gastranaerophilales bacterium]|nr:MerR family transcriptional regulator [Candidatus Gastranaerophilales bacterium]
MTKETINNKSSEINPDKPVFPISVVADVLQVHQRTLRIYNEENILVPARSPKNRRLYSMKDIEKGKFVQYLSRELGINIIGIKIIMEMLKEKNINCEDYKQHIDLIAKKLNITYEIQQKNKEKLSKRGRKPSKIENK